MRQQIEQLITKYQKSLFNIAYSICQNYDDANDVVQDTFIQYMKSEKDFNEEEHIRAYDSRDIVKDYKIFKIPFITLSDRILENVRNLTYRFMPNQMTLFPMETKQYDSWVLRELLNNCIAHSDYTLGGRIYVNEFEDKLILANPGSFIPGSIEPILKPSYTSPFCLIKSMPK